MSDYEPTPAAVMPPLRSEAPPLSLEGQQAAASAAPPPQPDDVMATIQTQLHDVERAPTPTPPAPITLNTTRMVFGSAEGPGSAQVEPPQRRPPSRFNRSDPMSITRKRRRYESPEDNILLDSIHYVVKGAMNSHLRCLDADCQIYTTRILRRMGEVTGPLIAKIAELERTIAAQQPQSRTPIIAKTNHTPPPLPPHLRYPRLSTQRCREPGATPPLTDI
ncbi:hypothetical protein FN846DRAFT_894993 [Sphaerosporella brunnea]|uniref:Uncharacterized protein n=1 Tax=Sphaerosporella brunnea TaxID=1250544 RepID=A0A5J5EFR8_9PEZI|nr:hypothetical protein FN846DRAFT_894993 [Sphaerosporella brunnea]